MKRNLYLMILPVWLAGVVCNVFAQPVASFTISGTNGYCRNTTINFVNTTTGATSYYWEFGDGNVSSQATPSNLYTGSGTYTVTLTASNGSQTSVAKKSLYVRDYPSAYFNVTSAGGSGELKPGELITPIDYSNGSVTYFWNNGNGITSGQKKFACSYPAAGNYTLSLTTTNGCGDSSDYSTQVTVIDTNTYSPMASGYVSPTVACPGTVIYFSNYTNTYTSVKWILGDGNTISNAESFEYVYATPGLYQIKQVAYYKTHTDTAFYEVKITSTELDKSSVYGSVNPQVWDPNTSKTRYLNCVGSPFRFSGSYGDEIVKHYWKLPGGVVLNARDTQYTFTNLGDYPLVYQFENSCGVTDSFTYLLSVRVSDSIPAPYVYVSVNAGPGGTICPGNKAYFSAYANGTAQTKWIFHDGTTFVNQEEVSKVYATAGTYEVKFVLQNGCRTDTTFRSVVVSATAPSYAAFTTLNAYSPTSPLCAGDSVYCMADSNTNSIYKTVTITQHNWNMGDGTVYHTPLVRHKYAAAGYYSISHETVNSCGEKAYSTSTLWLNSTTVPVANFYLVNNAACVNDSIMIDQFSTRSDSIIIRMGDGNSIYLNRDNFFPHLWYVYHQPGDYTVRLYAYNNCGVDSAQDFIRIYPLPNASINYSDTSVKTNTSLTFSADFTGTVRHIWKYGFKPEDTSSAATVNVTYPLEGKYPVYLITWNASGCENIDSLWVTVANNAGIAEDVQGGVSMVLYPNPVTSTVQVRIETGVKEAVALDLFDLQGRLIYHRVYKACTGPLQVEYDLTSLPAGVYFISARSDSGSKTMKLLRQ